METEFHQALASFSAPPPSLSPLGFPALRRRTLVSQSRLLYIFALIRTSRAERRGGGATRRPERGFCVPKLTKYSPYIIPAGPLCAHRAVSVMCSRAFLPLFHLLFVSGPNDNRSVRNRRVACPVLRQGGVSFGSSFTTIDFIVARPRLIFRAFDISTNV